MQQKSSSVIICQSLCDAGTKFTMKLVNFVHVCVPAQGPVSPVAPTPLVHCAETAQLIVSQFDGYAGTQRPPFTQFKPHDVDATKTPRKFSQMKNFRGVDVVERHVDTTKVFTINPRDVDTTSTPRKFFSNYCVNFRRVDVVWIVPSEVRPLCACHHGR